MQTLIYGFKPYGQFSENITEKIITDLPDYPNIVKKIFDVEFNYDMFAEALEQIQPKSIIGLGQHPRAKKLRIERKAMNIYKSDQGKRTRIRENGPGSLFVNLKLPLTNGVTKTYDAGSYVCNFSMYLMCEYIIKTEGKFAFLHVPVMIDRSFIKSYLLKCINNC